MPYEKIQAQFEDETPIRMVRVTVGVYQFAAGPVVVTLGGVSLSEPESTFAVMAWDGTDTHKHINLRQHCVAWLVRRGINTAAEAELLLDLSEAVCEADDNRVPPLHVQEARGQYLEELERIRDRALGAIADGLVKDRRELRELVIDAVDKSVYACDFELGLVVLQHSGVRDSSIRRLVKGRMFDAIFLDVMSRPVANKLPKKVKA